MTLAFVAGIAHLAERHLAKVEVASSNLVARSKKDSHLYGGCLFWHQGQRFEKEASRSDRKAPGALFGRRVRAGKRQRCRANLVARSIVVADCVSFATTFSFENLISHSLHRSSSQNRTRFTGLRFCFGGCLFWHQGQKFEKEASRSNRKASGALFGRRVSAGKRQRCRANLVARFKARECVLFFNAH